MGLKPENTVIGFIGTGVMGGSMAQHLMSAGYELHVYTRTRSKAEMLVSKGAIWHDGPSSLAKVCNIIITIVGYPQDVEEIYLGENGVIHHARQGTYLVDMTTSSPALAVSIHKEAQAKGMHALDAPVSGGDLGAREARLSIMVGGDPEVFETLKSVFEIIGKNIVYQGAAGAGQHTKMSNQIAIASNMIGVCEALIYAQKAGLDPVTVLRSIETGAAGSWSLSNLGPRMIKGDFAPGFYVKHIIKDLKIALEEAERMNLEVPGLSLALSLYNQLAEEGKQDSGTQALYQLLNK